MQEVERYAVGTKVVHPWHGAGTIVRIQEKNIGDLHHTYYVINTAPGTMELMVPVRKAESMGLRLVGGEGQLRQWLANCCVPPEEGELEKDFRARQAAIGEQLKSGSFEQAVQAVRVLHFLNNKRPLGMGDRRLFDQGKGLLAGELALASDQPLDEAKEELEVELTKMTEIPEIPGIPEG